MSVLLCYHFLPGHLSHWKQCCWGLTQCLLYTFIMWFTKFKSINERECKKEKITDHCDLHLNQVFLLVSNGINHSPPTLNGAPSPPQRFSNGPASSTSSALTNQQLPATCGARQLSKLKRFLTTLQQFGNDISPEIGEKVRTLVLALVVSMASLSTTALSMWLRTEASREIVHTSHSETCSSVVNSTV